MSKERLKQIVAGIVIAVAIASLPLVTGALGRLAARAGSDADPTGVFSELVIPVNADEIDWDADADLSRPMEPATRTAVGEAYLIALAMLDGNLATSLDDLAVHLTGPALEAAKVAEPDARVVHRSHHMRVVFYSADGQVVELEDHSTRVVAAGGASALIHTVRAVAVLIRIDGVWHLRHRLVDESSVDLIGVAAGEPRLDHLQPRKETT
jgi:hypothetical protein